MSFFSRPGGQKVLSPLAPMLPVGFRVDPLVPLVVLGTKMFVVLLALAPLVLPAAAPALVPEPVVPEVVASPGVELVLGRVGADAVLPEAEPDGRIAPLVPLPDTPALPLAVPEPLTEPVPLVVPLMVAPPEVPALPLMLVEPLCAMAAPVANAPAKRMLRSLLINYSVIMFNKPAACGMNQGWPGLGAVPVGQGRRCLRLSIGQARQTWLSACEPCSEASRPPTYPHRVRRPLRTRNRIPVPP